jgi:hypothetical protein
MKVFRQNNQYLFGERETQNRKIEEYHNNKRRTNLKCPFNIVNSKLLP